jgi:hypothetical protein
MGRPGQINDLLSDVLASDGDSSAWGVRRADDGYEIVDVAGQRIMCFPHSSASTRTFNRATAVLGIIQALTEEEDPQGDAEICGAFWETEAGLAILAEMSELIKALRSGRPEGNSERGVDELRQLIQCFFGAHLHEGALPADV